jgi:choline dehydrogenase
VHTFDYVIVGGGSAGCVLAARLSEERDVKVLLLEAGPEKNIVSDLPGLLLLILRYGWFSWPYSTEPQAQLEGRRLACPRGRVIGGGSAINGMLYDRGDPSDYDRWAKYGVKGWSYQEVLPYFRRAETWRHGESPYHGKDGPIQVGRPGINHPLAQAWVEAGRQAGLPYNEDFSVAPRDGVGPTDVTAADGRRSSTGDAYLREARRRPNLKIYTKSVAHRIVVENGRAVAVEFSRAGQLERVAAHEIIVSAGAINSPKLLLLSGIGDPAVLSQLGIPVTADLPGVGKNLSDHPALTISHRCFQPISIFNYFKPTELLKAGLQYLSSRTGPLGVPVNEVIAYMRSSEQESAPNLKLTLGMALYSDFGRQRGSGHGFFGHLELLRPQSVGTVRLRSTDPADPPLIDPNFLWAEADWSAVRHGIRWARRLFSQPAFDLYRGEEIAPGRGVQSNSEIDAWVRGNATSDLHSVGTCHMGTDRDAVVDENLLVHGVEGLRVVDASVIPNIISGNTNVPVIMVAEKASDLIKRCALLPAAVPADTRQREPQSIQAHAD